MRTSTGHTVVSSIESEKLSLTIALSVSTFSQVFLSLALEVISFAEMDSEIIFMLEAYISGFSRYYSEYNNL